MARHADDPGEEPGGRRPRGADYHDPQTRGFPRMPNCDEPGYGELPDEADDSGAEGEGGRDGPPVRGLNWNLLRVFVAVAEARSITRAARNLGLSQPSVSQGLRRLESSLGCRLVHRDSRRFALTRRGEDIHVEAAEMLRAVERIEAIARLPDEGSEAQLHVQIISNLISPLVDEALRLFHQRFPSVTLRLDVRNSAEIVRRIRDERTGLGICLLPRPILGLTCTLLYREAFAVYCGAEHALFGAPHVPLRDLASEPFVAFTCAEDGAGLEPMIMLREGLGLGRRISGSSANLEEVRRMIVSGLGIGILPVMAARNDEAAGLLWPIEVGDQPLGADVWLVRNPQATATPSEQGFMAVIDELLPLFPDLH